MRRLKEQENSEDNEPQQELVKQSMEEKRESKYMSKFGFRVKQASKKCQSGQRMGTPAPIHGRGVRAIAKYLKINEVSRSKPHI